MTIDANHTRRPTTRPATDDPPVAASDELAFRSASPAEAALAWWEAGCSVVPVRTNGSKVPVGDRWVQYQRRRAPRERVARWFAGGHPGIGIVCGAVSGHLEMFEFEGLAVREGLVERLRDHLAAAGHAGLWHTVINGYVERSPAGGLHVMVRVVGGVDRNTKLAQRLARDEEMTDEERNLFHTKGTRPRRILIETRGEGGFVVVAPSQGPVHESGLPWRALTGTPATIPTLTAAQRDTLHLAARTLDQVPPPPPIPDPAPDRSREPDAGLLPGDDFNLRAEWGDILREHGWEPERVEANRTFWCRPGKDHGTSAVTGGDRGEYMWVFSSSTNLPSDQAMSKFRVYAFLDHGGDFAAAARALHNAGYGHSGEPTTRRRPRPHTARRHDRADPQTPGTADALRSAPSTADTAAVSDPPAGTASHDDDTA